MMLLKDQKIHSFHDRDALGLSRGLLLQRRKPGDEFIVGK
jgi:hypothetical protein